MITAVIPNWNGATRLKTTLDLLHQQSRQVHRVIVVDNGSTDGSAAIARRAGAEVLELGTNKGFSAAVNCGIRSARTEWIAILNNDVALELDWLAVLLDRAEGANAWFATGKLLDFVARQQIDGAFDAVCRGACAWRCGH